MWHLQPTLPLLDLAPAPETRGKGAPERLHPMKHLSYGLLALLVSSCCALKANHTAPPALLESHQTPASSASSFTSRWSNQQKQLADVEDMDFFGGMPILAWVVVVDVIACILYFVGMRTVSGLARKKAEDTDYFLQSPVWSFWGGPDAFQPPQGWKGWSRSCVVNGVASQIVISYVHIHVQYINTVSITYNYYIFAYIWDTLWFVLHACGAWLFPFPNHFSPISSCQLWALFFPGH